MKGIVTFFSDYRGYGFILGEDNKEYFAHVSQINSDEIKALEKDQQVEFKPIRTGRGLQAKNVIILTQAAKTEKDTVAFVLKRNPFTPQSPVTNTKMFAGRRDAILNAIDAIFNNKNILILGPRGIGKSSLCYQLMYLTQGNTELLDKLKVSLGSFRFDNSTGDHRCLPGNSLVDICNGLLTTFCNSIGKGLEEEKRKLVCGIDLKIFKVSSEKESKKVSPTDVSLAFVAKIQDLAEEYRAPNSSITFVIDELDVLDPDINIASFLKATTEKFQLDGKVNVSFIVSGVTGTITDLISQHPSVSRLFENLSLPRMQPQELSEIIEVALKGTGTTIVDDAKNKIIVLSNQFPQPVHLLGYHAFKIDSDNVIQIDDVDAAENFIVSDIKKQDFESKFNRIAPGPMTELIRALALASHDTVNLSFLRANLKHMSDDKIVGTMSRLQEQGIVAKQHRGIYRFEDPLFKVYLRWLFGI